MRVAEVIAASLVAPLVAAHGGMEGAPRIFGMPKQLRASNPFAGYQARHAAHPVRAVAARQVDGPERCGPDNGNQVCAEGVCCSASGYCGTTTEHCQAPDCLFNFGPGCDANKTPAGESTRNDARPQLGSIPYGGAGVYVCNNPGHVAITFDDGPYIYTEGVMALFEARGAHATFFVTGNNIGKGAIDENWAGVIKKMYDNGHQVASHTWSHQDLSVISKEEVYDQMVKNEMAIRNIIGKYPTYMRPPYSSCNGVCQEVLKDLGYVVSYFDLDTADYLNLTPELIQNAKDNFKEGIDTRNDGPYDGDRLAIAHDIHQLTAENLTAYMLEYLYSQGLKAVTMGECMQDPAENWYRDSTPAPPSTSSSSTVSSATPTPTGPTSTDGSCGASNSGMTCIGFVGPDGLSECCSEYGWCGNSNLHCQTGCQAGFGKCGAQPSASPSASVSVSASSTGPVPTPTGPTTTDGSCGASNNGMTCIGFVGPDGLSECCSEYGWCGNSNLHCQTGCQAGFGKCGDQDISSSSAAVSASSSMPASSSQAASSSADASSTVDASSSASQVSSAPSATPTTSGEMSRDGSCGGEKGYTCVGFHTLEGVKSECCSEYGWCGSSDDHCGTGCNPVYGNCPSTSSSSSSVAVSSASESASASSSAVSASADASSTVDASSSASQVSSAPSATPTTSGEMSRDGSCGGEKGYTCVGFHTLEGVKSECCSEYGWCGSSDDHCGTGCNPVYGNCPSTSSSSSSVAVSSASESVSASSSAVSASASASDVLSSSVHSASASASSDVLSSSVHSASASASASSSDVLSSSASASASASVSDHVSESASASDSASISASITSSVYSASASASASSSGLYPTSSDVSASKDDEPTGSMISEYPASTPSAVSSEYPVSSVISSEYPASSAIEPSTSCSTSTLTPYPTSFSTATRPSSTPCSTSTAAPTPTAYPVSTDGKCGAQNGGQTCAGYKSPWGIKMGCCCKQSGKCSVDPWACGVGCDKGYGKCWY
ncbi:hypothetical protein BDW02DRAFT_579755 [Decorospora gaudefroyi]|uniref:Glycoside hydrolase/deacetylase n=1 Tax=Decorospora gaudefroyi TaxID=184978 RepID=A0A6A5KIF5_9PLEO|nr:hypothetical protein BDW02DRAFT_579755 [Decorospora gaudefroyi]